MHIYIYIDDYICITVHIYKYLYVYVSIYANINKYQYMYIHVFSEFDDPRKANNHTAANAAQWRKTAQAVMFTYGHKYQRAAQYLEDLASNTMWENSDMAPLPWHAQAQVAARLGEPRYVMHQAVLDALAPSVPLRAIFGGARNL